MMKNSPVKNASSHQRAAADANSFDPWIIWVAFRRSWTWALPVGAVLAGLTSFYVINNFVPSFRANHMVEANQDYLVFKNVMPTIRKLAQSEKSILLSPLVLDPVLADPDVMTAPSLSDPNTAESNLLKNLKISSGGTDERMVVSYTDTDRTAAMVVCNAVVESYLRHRDGYDENRVSKLEDYIEPEIARWESEVENRRAAVRTLSKNLLGAAPDDQASMAENARNLTLMSSLRSQITALTVEIAVDEATVKQLEQKAIAKEAAKASGELEVIDEAEFVLLDPEEFVQKEKVTEALIEQEVDLDPDLIEARKQIELFEDRVRAIENDPKRFGIRQKDHAIFKAKAEEWKAFLPQAEELARSKAIPKLEELVESDYQSRLANARVTSVNNAKVERFLAEKEEAERLLAEQAEREIRKSKLEVLTTKYEEEKRRLEQFGGMTAELQFAQSEYLIANEVLGKLRSRVAQIKTERNQAGAVRSLVRATLPRGPVEELPFKKLGLAGVVAMFAPFLIGLLLELRAQRLTDSTMCDKNGLSVIGEIAQLPNGPNSARGRRVFEESIDTLRSSLFLSIDTRETRSIAVVSSMSGEGKSSVSSQLALSIAKATGKTVLLVDADLRCPDQHEIFGLEIGPGLTGVLSGTATLSEAINTSLGKRIHVLPAGPLSSSPHRLLSPAKMQEFVEEALKEYAYVVMDTAPVLSAGESLAVASAVDATLLCVMRDLSRVENVARTTRRLEAVGATLAGTVFSGVSARQYAYRYGDYQYAAPGGNVSSVS